MPKVKTSALAKLSPKQREKVLTVAAEVTLARYIMKRRADRQAKMREEQAFAGKTSSDFYTANSSANSIEEMDSELTTFCSDERAFQLLVAVLKSAKSGAFDSQEFAEELAV